MALWTLFGLASGRATTSWPREGGKDGQEGVLGMPRYNPDACREGCDECAAVCPTRAIEARDGALAVDYGRCVVCQLCTEVCPTDAMEASNDWAFGVGDRDGSDPVGRRGAILLIPATGAPGISAQPSYPSRRRRLVQRMLSSSSRP